MHFSGSFLFASAHETKDKEIVMVAFSEEAGRMPKYVSTLVSSKPCHVISHFLGLM